MTAPTDMLPAMAIAARPPADHPDRLLAEGPEASLGKALIRHIRPRPRPPGSSPGPPAPGGAPTRSPWSPW
ncbi:hypothetical protein [Streptomyces sp. M2CJ-2]|uniref:hypothetical protein n=1 Tax=Streptomyces sp. M2CJ-2 TaxID=2803948 RepID=UPI001F34EA37|nr:hypothetical protein [Streptomyces sp. M2CJ-2]